ncbi:MAG: hypothetical protein U0L84_04150 [Acutalibacteraceae bacterium]|nr:hypothetical protein [Acutalibacteraceae bacterium]
MENTEITPEAQTLESSGGEETAQNADTTPQTEPQSITVPIKFNKETKLLSLEDAASLAQKGMKLDAISGELSRLRKIAGAKGKSISEFLSALERQQIDSRKEELLSECGGNEELAERIMKLEANTAAKDSDLAELQQFFPAVKAVEDLPQTVVERAKMLGSNLLNEYLRYREGERIKRRESERSLRTAAAASVGSQGNSGTFDSANAEFLKALWGR